MSADDFHSFVSKFIALWNNGRDVTLQFRSINGKAKVTMELDIESLAPLPVDGGRIACQARRREKRASERKKSTAEEAIIENVAVIDVVEPFRVNKVDEEVVNIANSDSNEVDILSIPVKAEEGSVPCVADKPKEVGVPCVTDKIEEVGVSCVIDKTGEVDMPCLVIDRYGNFHLTDTDTDTDMLIITDANTDTNKKKTNSPIPIPIPIRRKGIHRYQYEKLLDTDTNTIIFI